MQAYITNRLCEHALQSSDKSKWQIAKVVEKLPKDKDLEVEVTRLRGMRTVTDPFFLGNNFKRKAPQMLEKIPGAIKINVVHKITLLRGDNISVHSINKFFKTPCRMKG